MSRYLKQNVEPVKIETVLDEHNEERDFEPSFWWNNRRYYLDDFIRCHDNPWTGGDFPEHIHGYEAENYFNPLYIETIGDHAVNIYEYKENEQ